LLAATTERAAGHEVFNIALYDRTSLNELFEAIRATLAGTGVSVSVAKVHREFRPGDVRHSEANVEKACTIFGFQPTHPLREGRADAMPWYVERLTQTGR
jgi:UDP-N-acetylglucosamine/UDP-N-acetylgalactosamine 4-epimerase